MIRRPPRSTPLYSSAASDVYKRQVQDNAVRRSTEARLFAELARGHQETSCRSVDSSVEAVVIAAARLLGGADIELLLIATDDPVRYLGNEFGVSERTRVPPSAFDEPWVLRPWGRPESVRGARMTGRVARS